MPRLIDSWQQGDRRASSQYDQAVTDVEASIRELQAESPTLSEVHDRDM